MAVSHNKITLKLPPGMANAAPNPSCPPVSPLSPMDFDNLVVPALVRQNAMENLHTTENNDLSGIATPEWIEPTTTTKSKSKKRKKATQDESANGEPKKPHPWQAHLKQFRANHPDKCTGKSCAQISRIARDSYKPREKCASCGK